MNMNSYSLPPQTSIPQVRLRIRSLETMAHFYSSILGFERLPGPAPDIPAFGPASDKPQIILTEDRAATLRSALSLGLHHVALRYPTRRDLAHALRRLAEHNYPISGATHHGIAESIYLADPEGNGIELFAAVSADQLSRSGPAMGGAPLDLRSLFALAEPGPTAEPPPLGLEIGHIHLQVADLVSAERFFHEFLGLSVRARVPGAIFLTATDEHHQIAVNVWERYEGTQPESVGLMSYRFAVPFSHVVDDLRERSALFGYQISPGGMEPDQQVLRIIDPNGQLLEFEASTV